MAELKRYIGDRFKGPDADKSNVLSSVDNGAIYFADDSKNTYQKISGSWELISTLNIGGLSGNFSEGSIPFANAVGNLTEDNSNLYFDNSNNFLGIQTNNPTYSVHSAGSGAFEGKLGVGTTGIEAMLHVVGQTSGETIARVEGTQGTLFSVTDSLEDSLFSVNNIAGIPVFEAFSDDRIVMGEFNAHDFVLKNNNIGFGTDSPDYKLQISGDVVPEVTESFDLGKENLKWGNVFAANLSGAENVFLSGFSDGSILFADSVGKITEDVDNFKWDGSPRRLTINSNRDGIVNIIDTGAQNTQATLYTTIDGSQTLRLQKDGSIRMSGPLSLYSGVSALTGTLKTYLNPEGNSWLNGGNVGINTTSPSAPLHIVHNSTEDALFIITSEDGSSAGPVLDLCRESASADNGDYLGQVKFKGNNDIGQTVVYSKITAKIGDATDTTEDGLLEVMVKKDGTNTIVSRFTSSDLKLINGVGLQVDGDVGIGTTSPDYKLQVDGEIAPETANAYDIGAASLPWRQLYLQGGIHITGSSQNSGALVFNNTYNGATTLISVYDTDNNQLTPVLRRANSNGAISLGTDDSLILGAGESRSTVESNYAVGNETLIGASDFNILFYTNLQNGWGSKNTIQITQYGDFVQDDDRAIMWGIDSGAYIRGNTSSNQLILGNNGTGVVYVDEHFYPAFDNQIDLGKASSRWRDLYVAGTIYATGISADVITGDFSSGSVLFAGPQSTIIEDNTQFYWDDVNNRLGIGTNVPDERLDVRGGLQIGDAGTSSYTNYNTTDYYEFKHNGSGLLFLQGDKVAIGGTSPSVQLDVRGSIDLNGNIIYWAHDGSTNANNDYIASSDGAHTNGNGNGFFLFKHDSSRDTSAEGGNSVLDCGNIWANRSEDNYFAGNVGVGTKSPVNLLHLKSSTNINVEFLKFEDSDGNILGDVSTDSAGNNRLHLEDTSSNITVKLNTNGSSYFNGGNVGIGTTNPSTLLDITGGILSIRGDVDAAANIYSTNGSWKYFQWYNGSRTYYNGLDNTANRFVFGADAAGSQIYYFTNTDVGIGTSSPSTDLDVAGGANFDGGVTGQKFDSDLFASNSHASNSFLDFDYDDWSEQSSITYLASISSMLFATDTNNNGPSDFVWFSGGVDPDNGSELMRLTNEGNLGVGGVNPSHGIHLQKLGSNAEIRIESDQDAFLTLEADNDNATEDHNAYIKLSQDNGGVSGFFGFIGISGTNPENGTYTDTTDNSLLISNDWLSSSADIHFGTQGAVRMTVGGDGNVGIGTNAPSHLLNVVSTAVSTDPASFEASAGNSEINVRENSAQNTMHIQGKDNAGTVTLVLQPYGNSYLNGSDVSNFGIGTNNPLAKLNVLGDCLFAGNITGRNIFPQASGIYDIGSESLRWSEIFGETLNLRTTTATNFIIIEDTATSEGMAFRLSSNEDFLMVPQSAGSDVFNQEFGYNNTNEIWFCDTRFGVKTTSPTADLNVVGTTYLGGNTTGQNIVPQADSSYDLGSSSLRWANLYVDTIDATDIASDFTQGSVVFANSDGDLAEDNSNFYWNDTDNELGIGTTSTVEKLTVNGNIVTTSTSAKIGFADGNGADVYITFDDNNPTFTGGNTTHSVGGGFKFIGDKSTINKGNSYIQTEVVDTNLIQSWHGYISGNLGIGTNSPQSSFHILGSENTPVRIESSDSICEIQLLDNSTSNNSTFRRVGDNLSILLNGGNVGIATDSPAESLEIANGNIFLDSDTDEAGIAIHRGSERKWWMGIYSGITDDQFMISYGGSINTNNVFTISESNVGIGITNPSRSLSVYKASSPIIQLINSTTSTGQNDGLLIQQAGVDSYIENTEVGDLFFRTSATNRMTIDSNGNVGIGTATPSRKFQLKNGSGLFQGTEGGMDVRIDTTSAGNSTLSIDRQTSAGKAAINIEDGGNVKWQFGDLGSSNKFQILNDDLSLNALSINVSNNNIGMGTNDPSARLDVRATGNDTTEVLAQFAEATPNGGMNIELINGSADLSLRRTGGATGVYINSNGSSYFDGGNIAIGTTTPNSPLHVKDNQDSSFASGITIERSASTQRGYINLVGGAFNINADSGLPIKFRDGGTANMTILGNGDVGIGIESPSYKLEVNGSFAATTKSFVIDHPTKEGKKLQYGVTEAPEHSVFVRGRTKSNIIELPDYWTGLVHEDSITVNLTPIGKHQKLYVEDISNNQVIIANDSVISNKINCFYTIFAERKDVERLQVEV